MKKTTLIWITIVISTTSFGQLIPNNAYKKVINITMENFWGNAKLKDGSYVKAKSERERKTIPIALENAGEVIKVGELSGLAKWCGLKWQKNYRRTTKSARAYGLNEKQVAFVGFLHGVSMGLTSQVVKGKTCSSKQKENIEAQLKNTNNKAINFKPSILKTLNKGY